MLSKDLDHGELAARLLRVSERDQVCLLDSCGVGGGWLIAGIGPVFSERIAGDDGDRSLRELEAAMGSAPATIFTASYDLGLKLHGIDSRHDAGAEPDFFAAGFRSLVLHDHASGKTFFDGDPRSAAAIEEQLRAAPAADSRSAEAGVRVRAETGRTEYIERVEAIRELIRAGETYQANLTQKFRIPVAGEFPARDAYARLRDSHPAAYSAFIDRGGDQAVSISPERFFRIRGEMIEAAPIKGTRRRTGDLPSDDRARAELASSGKDRAENIMITDLLRNDLGRVCEFGSVRVGELCSIEELPSLFHLVSTVSGRLRPGTGFPEAFRALFPCGSITGAPKHRTMEIIDRIEPSPRGLSMGAIGVSIDGRAFPRFLDARPEVAGGPYVDLSVAIRTMVIRGSAAEFNTGGGVVIDSDPSCEYEESLDKASAIFDALGVRDRPST